MGLLVIGENVGTVGGEILLKLKNRERNLHYIDSLRRLAFSSQERLGTKIIICTAGLLDIMLTLPYDARAAFSTASGQD